MYDETSCFNNWLFHSNNLFIEENFLTVAWQPLATLFIWYSNESSLSSITPRFLAEFTNRIQKFWMNTPQIIISGWIDGGAMTNCLISWLSSANPSIVNFVGSTYLYNDLMWILKSGGLKAEPWTTLLHKIKMGSF